MIIILQDLRDWLGCRFKINSGARCAKHNKDEGGEDDSQHLFARAADGYPSKKPVSEAANYMKKKYPDSLGIGIYPNFIHIDTRGTKARW